MWKKKGAESMNKSILCGLYPRELILKEEHSKSRRGLYCEGSSDHPQMQTRADVFSHMFVLQKHCSLLK